jgi:hypothetical protein
VVWLSLVVASVVLTTGAVVLSLDILILISVVSPGSKVTRRSFKSYQSPGII